MCQILVPPEELASLDDADADDHAEDGVLQEVVNYPDEADLKQYVNRDISDEAPRFAPSHVERRARLGQVFARSHSFQP